MKRAGGEEATRVGEVETVLLFQPTVSLRIYLYSIQAVDTNKVL